VNRRLNQRFSGVLLILVLAACGQPATTSTDHHHADASTAEAHAGHQHTPALNSTAPIDAQFIDSMIEHHRGAIDMAEQALQAGQHAEIKHMASAIIAGQQQEIDQMTAWRLQWYPNLPPTSGMGMAMGEMEVSSDASKSFDQRFIEAMVSHHTGAIDMAYSAQTKAEHPELAQLVHAIITAQEAEIGQMKQWQHEWFTP